MKAILRIPGRNFEQLNKSCWKVLEKSMIIIKLFLVEKAFNRENAQAAKLVETKKSEIKNNFNKLYP